MTRILIIAHAPLAHAMRECALHVFSDAAADITAVDVHARLTREELLGAMQIAVEQLGEKPALVLCDIFGATPCNLAREALVDTKHVLLTGLNLPMLLRAITYRNEAMEVLVERALVGGSQGLMKVAVTAPQNQHRKAIHDQERHHHQQ